MIERTLQQKYQLQTTIDISIVKAAPDIMFRLFSVVRNLKNSSETIKNNEREIQ